MEERFLPPAIVRDAEAWHRFPGIEVIANLASNFFKDRLHSREAVGAHNRWNGSNFASYVNPMVDGLLDRLAMTIPRPDRVSLTRELVREVMTDMAIMPTFWDPDPILALGPVRNLPAPSAITQVHTWNVYAWDLERAGR